MKLFNSTKGSSTLLAIILTALIVGFGVYYWQQQQVVEAPTPLTFKDKIEDFASYQPSDYDRFLTANCDGYADFHQKLISGEVKEKKLTDDSIPYSRFIVYLTPNYENWTTDELKEVNDCMDGVGQEGGLKAFDDYLLWGLTNCGGAVVSPSLSPEGYAKHMGCEGMAKQLREYLGININY